MNETSPARTVIVTGGTGGLGAAVTRHLLDAGWRLVVPWYVEAELDRVVPHPNLETIRADLSDEQDVEAVVECATKDEARPLYGVVNLVGGFAAGRRVHETPIEVLEAQLSINLTIAYRVIQAALPALIRHGGGSVVCIGSAAAVRPFPGAATYVASKAAVSALVQALAVEYAGDNIRVNGLLPTMVDTPANRDAMPEADRSSWARPTDIAEVIGFLLGDSSRAVSGASIPVVNVAGSD
ncbi:SDR family NAD(P)-dependent oxidoreductase [Rhodococcus aetherivorans]|uniref:SDR family NAD(P)-dependent oxidoreductase n=1 Tax=Rhodococcus aetherivorans TaxID=191292 RepID=UPI0002D2494B|nr:SDR family oxidoreductase [Rhodococcus aetherivorans]CCW12818.1 short-chain dehydrogenase/reductase SDR [Rhodococcus aetherivorans]